MGIQGLFKFLDEKSSNDGVYHTNLRSFMKFCKSQRKRIHTIGIDASLFLYRYSSPNIEYMENQLSQFLNDLENIFQKYHIKPLFVFDGKYHEETIQDDHQLIYEKKKTTFHSRFLQKKRFRYLSKIIHSFLLWKTSFETNIEDSIYIENNEESEINSSFSSDECSDLDISMDSLEGISKLCSIKHDILDIISPIQIRNKYVLMNELLSHTAYQIQHNMSNSLYQIDYENILYKINKYYCKMDMEMIQHIDEFIIQSNEELETKRESYIKKSLHMGPSKKNLCISLLEYKNIPFYVPNDSYYEADLILTQLCKNDSIQAVISDDSDMLCFGTPYVFRNFHIHSEKLNASFIFYDYEKILHSLQFNSIQFIDLCILCGNDYNKRLPGFYPEYSYEKLKEFHVIENILKHDFKDKQIKIPKQFSFSKSRRIFQMTISNSIFESIRNLF
jgi:5'-3' exonuclease